MGRSIKYFYTRKDHYIFGPFLRKESHSNLQMKCPMFIVKLRFEISTMLALFINHSTALHRMVN